MAGIYIHVPFCHSKCFYCDFYSAPQPEYRFDYYVSSVLAELHERENDIPANASTLYIGGGTPSVISARRLSVIIEEAKKYLSPAAEITVEVNPEDVTEIEISILREAEVNRMSMGVQSFNDIELKQIGRRHTASQAENAVEIIRRSGINNISCDLIYGLPGQTLESWENSLDRLLSLDLPHFSAYLLSYEPGTRLYASLLSGKVTQSDEMIVEEMYSYLCRRAMETGYEHYEISNFARPGKRSQHNSSYWNDESYIGLGPSAVSFDGHNIRRTNDPNMRSYLQGKRNFTIEEETETERLNDSLFIGLRTSEGVDLTRFPKYEAGLVRDGASRMIDSGLLRLTEQGYRIPEDHFLVSDMIIRELMI